jgi:glycosyltransferase involved in cell wall biosynthesis
MKIALVSSVVPFIKGGARNIVEWLAENLQDAGHQVEIVYLPFSEDPPALFSQLSAFRSVDLTDAADLVITFRPPAHVVKHPRKVVWFIHHIRSYYDMWDSEYRGMEDNDFNRQRRDSLREIDTRALNEATKVFSNSDVVASRLSEFNGVQATTLYPPVFQPERFSNLGDSDVIVCPARIEPHKRQHLLIEALALTKEPVALKFIGVATNVDYVDELWALAESRGVRHRIDMENRWASEEEKIGALSQALAVAYLPFDEDSYGYPTLEAAHSQKAVLTTSDSGGVTEFVIHGENGFVAEPDAESVALMMDRLFSDRSATRQMGLAAELRVEDLGISWAHIMESLLT